MEIVVEVAACWRMEVEVEVEEEEEAVGSEGIEEVIGGLLDIEVVEVGSEGIVDLIGGSLDIEVELGIEGEVFVVDFEERGL